MERSKTNRTHVLGLHRHVPDQVVKFTTCNWSKVTSHSRLTRECVDIPETGSAPPFRPPTHVLPFASWRTLSWRPMAINHGRRNRLTVAACSSVSEVPAFFRPVSVPSCGNLDMDKGLAVHPRYRRGFDPCHVVSATSQPRCHCRSGQPTSGHETLGFALWGELPSSDHAGDPDRGSPRRRAISLVSRALVGLWAGYVLLIIGMVGLTWAESVNKFFEPTVRIQTDRGHKVVDTGPYAIVRHPGYVSAFLAFLGMPLALGSLWALIPAVMAVPAPGRANDLGGPNPAGRVDGV